MPQLLFAFANDLERQQHYLRKLSRERTGIEAALAAVQQEDRFVLRMLYDASISSLVDAFQQARGEVRVFHFGGHAGSFELLLQDESGQQQLADGEGLLAFLGRQPGLQLVFLNGCHTHALAQGLIEAGIPLVIGTHQAVRDDIAQAFAVRFYFGLGLGLSVQRAYDDAVAEARMKEGGGELRKFYITDSRQALPADFPWKLMVAPGQEEATNWSLASLDPLLGLPPLPDDIDLPAEPFRFFRRYDREHARVFFGRDRYIRELYQYISHPDAPPLLLVHGQSGSGKSSLFAAGLLPRLEASYQVMYLRRRPEGLSHTLQAALEVEEALAPPSPPSPPPEEVARLLDELEQVLQAEGLDRHRQVQLQFLRQLRAGPLPPPQEIGPQALSPLARRWQELEQRGQRPLVVVLDQVEEAFSQQTPAQAREEWEAFLQALAALFGREGTQLQGKLILGFRKEYFPEIEKGLQQHSLPRRSLFLPTLSRADIEEVVLGLTRPTLQAHYPLQVDAEVPGLMAGELLQDNVSGLAPVLQIMLTHMWHAANKIDPHKPQFDGRLFRELKAKWWNLDQFVAAQTAQIHQQVPEAVDSGLLLDLLSTHCSPQGSTQIRQLADLQEQYRHMPQEPERLLSLCEQKQLLVREGTYSRLSHDTLAPVIQTQYQASDLPGQRARRILEGRVFTTDTQDQPPLDRFDLRLVEAGLHGMRDLSEAEQALLQISQEKEQRRRLWLAGITLLVLGLASWGIWSQRSQVQLSQNLALTTQSLDSLKADSVRLAKRQANQQAELDRRQIALDTQAVYLSQMEVTASQLDALAQISTRKAQKADLQFQAAQAAAQALTDLQAGKKASAIATAARAYELSPGSPAVQSALLEIAYDPGPTWHPAIPYYEKMDTASQLADGSRVEHSRDTFTLTRPNQPQAKSYTRSRHIYDAWFLTARPDRVWVNLDGGAQVMIDRGLLSKSLLTAHEGLVGINWLGAGGHLCWADQEGKIGWVDTTQTFPMQMRRRLSDELRSLDHSPDVGALLLSWRTQLRVISDEDLSPQGVWSKPDSSPDFTGACFANDGRYLLAPQFAGQLQVFQREGSDYQRHFTYSLPPDALNQMLDASLGGSPKRVFAIDNAQQLWWWNWETNTAAGKQLFEAPLSHLQVLPSGRNLLLGSSSGQLYLLDLSSQNQAPRIAFQTDLDGYIQAIAFHPLDSQKILVAAGRTLHLLKMDASGFFSYWSLGFDELINDISFSPDGRYAWVATERGLYAPLLIDPDEIYRQLREKDFLLPES